MMPKLTKCELEKRRTARELYEWVRRISDEFGQTAEGKTAMRLMSGSSDDKMLKRFCDEVWPLANYARLFFRDSNDVHFQPVVGNQPYDALLVDSSGSTPLEITRALYGDSGKQERLRCEHLDKNGWAPMTDTLKRVGKQGVAESESSGTTHTESFEKTICQISAAIKEKANKNYPSDTVLIVEFQDYFLQKDADQTALDAVAKSKLCELASGFSELALEADTGRFGFRYLTPGKPAASQGVGCSGQV